MAGKTKTQPEGTRRWQAPFSQKLIHTALTVIITLFLVGGGMYVYMFFQRDVTTSFKSNPGRARVSTVESLHPNQAKFDEPLYSMELPGDWKRLTPDLSGPFKKYSYQAGQKNADNRFLNIYVDGLPQSMPVNKAVAVRGEAGKLSHGMASENCMEFTTKVGNGTEPARAKWDGVDFLCDTQSVSRNVIGTSSPGNINKVELTGPGSPPHTFFFTYEDNNYTPDYQIFYDMLESFTAK